MAKPIIKRVVELLMTAALLLLMSYSLIGEGAHERNLSYSFLPAIWR